MIALSFVDSWLTIAAAIGCLLCVAHVISRAVDAGLELVAAWRGLDVQPAAEEAGQLREERGS